MWLILLGILFIGLGVWIDNNTLAEEYSVLCWVIALIAIFSGIADCAFSISPEEARCKSLNGKYASNICYVNGKEV